MARASGLTLFALCLLPLLLPEAATDWLEYRRDAVRAGEIWRLWSGHLVHYSAAHAVLDGLSCLILAAGLERVGNGRGVLFRLAAIAPALSLVMFFAIPAMAIYRGASGLAMALLAALGLSLWRARPDWRPGVLLLAAAVVLKLAADALGLAFLPSSLPAEVEVAWQVHLAGLLCGLWFWRDAVGKG